MKNGLQSYRTIFNKLIRWEDVDILVPIEMDVKGHRAPIVYVLRRANTKAVSEIHKEIESRRKELYSRGFSSGQLRFVGLLLRVSRFIRMFVYQFILLFPTVFAKYMGTVGVTSVSMFGSTPGWGLGIANHTTTITIGSVSKKPGIFNSQIGIRTKIHLTISLNHDLVDGAPAARFVHKLKRLIEAGSGLAV
jgi:pyruvate/2-oxoglutarate dehydrogenase complex dihydrolipoamide acyltransferase (E2) component